MARETIEYEDGSVVELNEDDAPEMTEERAKWVVAAKDFGGDSIATHDFIWRREEILRKAEAAGIPREVFLHFEPNKPGFEERAKVLLRASEIWAAE